MRMQKQIADIFLFCLCYKMTHGIFTDFYFLQIFDFDFFYMIYFVRDVPLRFIRLNPIKGILFMLL